MYRNLLLIFFCVSVCHAEVKLASLFKDNMVLQRDVKVPIWGWSKSGSSVTVSFAGQEVSVVADEKGAWMLELEPLKASFEEMDLAVSEDGKKTAVLKNVVVGDVWICAGQSNMEMSIHKVNELKTLVGAVQNVRTFKVKTNISLEPNIICEGTWTLKPPSSAVAFSFVHELQSKSNVPLGIIVSAWGSTSIEAWMPRDLTQRVSHFKTLIEEYDANIKLQDKLEKIITRRDSWSSKDMVFARRQSNIVYNAMMHPLIPYACRGVVWYQGERNAQTMHALSSKTWYERHSGILIYGSVLKEWIRSYRDKWGNKEMHFVVVALPGYGKTLDSHKQRSHDHPEAHSWAWMREQQTKVLELENTSLVNTIDLGDIKNIHPIDKQPVGQRVALAVQQDVLHQDIVSQGPIMSSAKMEKDKIIVSFTNADGLKTKDSKPLKGFWLCGKDKVWHQAEAKIVSDKVELKAESVSDPLYVRYAFVGKPDVNLVNQAGLPAHPFRTDNFKP